MHCSIPNQGRFMRKWGRICVGLDYKNWKRLLITSSLNLETLMVRIEPCGSKSTGNYCAQVMQLRIEFLKCRSFLLALALVVSPVFHQPGKDFERTEYSTMCGWPLLLAYLLASAWTWVEFSLSERLPIAMGRPHLRLHRQQLSGASLKSPLPIFALCWQKLSASHHPSELNFNISRSLELCILRHLQVWACFCGSLQWGLLCFQVLLSHRPLMSFTLDTTFQRIWAPLLGDQGCVKPSLV